MMQIAALRARMRRRKGFFATTALILVALAVLPGARTSVAVAAAPVAWEQWQHLEGVVDIALRSDGSLVVMAAGHLYLVSPDGTIAPLASGADGYAGDAESEQYLVVTTALPVESAGCAFAADDVYILDLVSPPGIARVDAAGRKTRLVAIPDVDTLSGIAFDTTGRFGHRLLVTAVRHTQTVVLAVDCQGGVTTVTDSAPTVEGGLVVAPAGFGQFGGDLIAPDELSGQLWAIGPDGAVRPVIAPELSVGGDTGVESLGFVPPGFGAGGSAYLADRGTPGNPFPGSDSLLRLSAQALAAAGVQDGDLLVATEGNGTTVRVHCEVTCTANPVADGPEGGHIEGHITVAVNAG